MRAGALTALLLSAFVAAPARGQDGTGAPQPPSAEPAASAPPDAKKDLDTDFEPESRRPSIALGPNGRGDITVALDLGWINSGLRAAIGLGSWFDLTLGLQTALLYDGFGAQSSFDGGVRISPFSQGLLRAGLEVTVGQLFSAEPNAIDTLTVVRGQATVGTVLDFATFYARFALRGLSGGDETPSPGWTRDEEVGLGVERTFWKNKLILGAEGYVWLRPGLSTLPQWRLRFGYAH